MNDRRPISKALHVLFHHHRQAFPYDAEEAGSSAIKALKISLVVLLSTAALQALIYAASGSVALFADTVHNFTDALTSLPLWLAFWLGGRKANRRYTYGYGKAEDVAGILIVVVIAVSAVASALGSIDRFFNPRPLQHEGWVALAAVVGFCGNSVAAGYRMRTGKKIGSAALVADGLHARSDALSSVGVLFAAAGSGLNFPAADPIVGLVITAAIVSVLVRAGREVFLRLMDAVSPDLMDRAEAALRRVPGVEDVSLLRIRWVGHDLRAEAMVTVDRDRPFVQAHQITEEAHHALLHELPALSEAIIHADPCGHDGTDPHSLSAHHFPGKSVTA